MEYIRLNPHKKPYQNFNRARLFLGSLPSRGVVTTHICLGVLSGIVGFVLNRIDIVDDLAFEFLAQHPGSIQFSNDIVLQRYVHSFFKFGIAFFLFTHDSPPF